MKLTENKLKQLILEVMKEEVEPARVSAEFQAMMDEFDEQLKAAVGEETYNKIKDLEKTEPEQAAELARVYVGNKYPQRLGGEDLIDRIMFAKGYERIGIETEFEEEEYFFGFMKKKISALQKRTYRTRTRRDAIDMQFRSTRSVGDVLVVKFKIFGGGGRSQEAIICDMRASVPGTNTVKAIGNHKGTIETVFESIKSLGVEAPGLERNFPQDEKQITEMYEDKAVEALEKVLGHFDKRVEEIKNQYNIQ